MNKKIVFLGLIIFFIGTGYFLFQELKMPTGLKGFYTLTEKDPLFYSPFLDGKEFKAALNRLKESERQIKKISIENYLRNENLLDNENSLYIKTLTKTDIFPYRFLEGLISINQETDKFLENPSTEKGYHLLTLYAEAADSYLQNISSLIEAIETIEEEQRKKPILFLDSQTNLNIILKDYWAIKKNAYTLKEEIDQRKKCLEGELNCLKLKKKHNIEYLLQALEQSLPPPPLEELKPEGKLVRDVIQITYPEAEVRGPYKIKSACWQSPNNNYWHWIYLIYEKKESTTLIISKLAEQNYYFIIRNPPRNKLEEAIAEKGLDFRPILATNHYNCTDSTFYPTLLTLDFIKEEVVKTGKEPKRLLEERQYKFLAVNQFGLLAPLINKTAFILDSQAKQLKLDKTIFLPLHYFYGLHSAYSIFYLPYAQSVWRMDEELQYLIPREEKSLIAKDDRWFYKLTELQNMGYSENEIKKFHSDLIGLLESLLELERKSP